MAGSISDLFNTARQSAGNFFHGIGDTILGGTSLKSKSPVNAITGVALAALGFVSAITGSPVFGTLVLVSGLAISFHPAVPDLAQIFDKAVQEIQKAIR